MNKNNICYILPICPEALAGWICTKFGIGGPHMDVINCANFFLIGSGVLMLWGVEIYLFP